MIELSASVIHRWGRDGKLPIPRHIDIDCPKCSRSIVNATIGWARQAGYIFAIHTCTYCGQAIYFFLFTPPSMPEEFDEAGSRLFVHPTPRAREEVEERLQKVSPRFQRIYNQALTAELLGLDEIAGMGQRKALEFLLKDFATYKCPEKQETIRKSSVKTVIDNYLATDYPRLKIASERAAWLGNDEAHYIRKWEGKDLQDLKTLIRLVLNEIDAQLLLEQLPVEMPHPGGPGNG